MKILAISDITWNNITLPNFTKIIEKVDPDLVLLAGDLVDDKIGFVNGRTFSRNKHWKNVFNLFDFLNKRKTQTYYIEGNWDYSPYYRKLTKNNFSYVKEISGNTVEFGNLKILGLPHYFTNSLNSLKRFCENVKQPFDIVLAHAEYKRRTWLFHLNCKLIITGHFDRQLCQIKDKVFISLENFPREYTLINYKPGNYTIQYIDEGIRRTTKCVTRKAKFSSGQLVWKNKPFRNRRQYADRVESLLTAKIELKFDKTKRPKIINNLIKRRVPKVHIEEYLGIEVKKAEIESQKDNKLIAEKDFTDL